MNDWSKNPPSLSDRDSIRRTTLRKATWKIIPFLCILYIFNILDRSNVGFARLGMQNDLGLSREMFDLGYGLFYVGYLLFEVPSNLLMRKVGARRWIARIMISWGIISCATMFVTGTRSFFLLRVLLGIAEAGFFPGIILYLSFWFPDRERARMTAYFMMAIALASVVGNPISGFIMEYLNLTRGLHGWQWLFLLEGIPAVILGFVVLFKLTDRPAQASWLNADEREWLVEQMEQEEKKRQNRHGADQLLAMLDWRVWLLIALYSTVAVGTNATGAYLPKLLKDQFLGWNTFEIGLLSALPHLVAIGCMALFSASSDRTGERRIHVAMAALLAAGGWALTAAATSKGLSLLGLCLAQAGMMSMLPIFWTLPTAFLTGAAAAGGIALINSVANIGGVFGPTILGRFGLWSMVMILFGGVCLAMCIRHDRGDDVSLQGGD
jgi:ACS family tartrate transporter-like MFS transporter